MFYFEIRFLYNFTIPIYFAVFTKILKMIMKFSNKHIEFLLF